ncbi:MAG: hypothetical protein NW217_09265 [Hyphomicrobiaceae bacterium]|nr:hypothetical protein [Hyphomicrobiaceae bacterium]
MPFTGPRTGVRLLPFAAAVGFFAMAQPALALEPKADEADKLKACEQSLCAMILAKDASGGDLTCDISKTWAKDKIEKGASSKSLSWGFGDARCEVPLKASRENVISALTKPAHVLQMDSHTVKCQIETEKEPTTIDVTLAPKVSFKYGKAEKAELNITKVDAPSVIKAVITGADWIEKNVGFFHGEMIEEINDFVGSKCAKRYPELVKK